MHLLIFTCLNVQTVHIKIVPDMDTMSFIQSLTRFTNLHGTPNQLSNYKVLMLNHLTSPWEKYYRYINNKVFADTFAIEQ